jgi:hypothetical protein
MKQITVLAVSSPAKGPLELDLALLTLVSGGLPRGTWSDVQGLPRGTWSEPEALPRGTWESLLPRATW